MAVEAELFANVGAYHGEGPFWDGRAEKLLIVDALAGSVISIDEEGHADRHRVPSTVVTVIRRRVSGGLVFATERGVMACDDTFSSFELIAEVTSDPALRTNDGGCDPLGGFVIGTMAYSNSPRAGSVFRIGADHGVTKILEGVSISNGVQWSPDGSKVFYVDTPTGRVDVFDVDPLTGAWSDRRPHLWIDASSGVPDGMAIDEEGGLWIALWGGGGVNHYDGNGRFVKTITVPGISQVSSCAFGGRNGATLFITTSRQNLSSSKDPLAGSVFALQTDFRGLHLAEFAG